MKYILVMVWLCCAIIPSTAQSDPKPDGKTLALLKKFRAGYTQALLSKTPETLAGYFANDLRLMPELQKTVMTKGNALAYHRAFIDRFDIDAYTREEIEVLDLGERVVEFGLFTQKLTHKRNRHAYTLNGKYADIWERSENGTLTLITECWNYNHTIPFADELIFGEVPAVVPAYQAHVPVNNSLRLELLAYNRLLESVISERNAALWSLFYTDDYMVLYSGHPVHKGRIEVNAYLEDHVKHLPVFEKLEIRNDRIDNLGRYVIEYASHIAMVRDGDWSGVFTGKDIRIWRREPDGTLRIFRGIAMYDQ